MNQGAWRISQLWPGSRPATIRTRTTASTEISATTARNQEVANPPSRSTAETIQATRATVIAAFETSGRLS